MTNLVNNHTANNGKYYLIDEIRTIAIIAVVLHHSINLWPKELKWQIHEYWAILSMNITAIVGMASFTLISGWLLCLTANRYTNVLTFIKKKSIRLLLPAFFWGLVYLLVFDGGYSVDYLPKCINGSHLWYFLMLFMCMMASIPLIYKQLPPLITICCISIIYATGIILMPFNRTFMEFVKYYPIFMLGWTMYIYRQQIVNIPVWIRIFVFILLWAILYLMLRIDSQSIPAFIIKHAVAALAIYLMLTCVSLPCRSVVRWISAGSFAIYILHQFVINWLCIHNASWLQTIPYKTSVATIFVVAFITPLIIKKLWPKLL